MQVFFHHMEIKGMEKTQSLYWISLKSDWLVSPKTFTKTFHCHQKPWNKNNESVIFKSKRSPAFLAQNPRKVNININKCKVPNIKNVLRNRPKWLQLVKKLRNISLKRKEKTMTKCKFWSIMIHCKFHYVFFKLKFCHAPNIICRCQGFINIWPSEN